MSRPGRAWSRSTSSFRSRGEMIHCPNGPRAAVRSRTPRARSRPVPRRRRRSKRRPPIGNGRTAREGHRRSSPRRRPPRRRPNPRRSLSRCEGRPAELLVLGTPVDEYWRRLRRALTRTMAGLVDRQRFVLPLDAQPDSPRRPGAEGAHGSVSAGTRRGRSSQARPMSRCMCEMLSPPGAS